MNKQSILVAGSLALDILPRFSQELGGKVAQSLLAEGRLTESSGFTVYLGGCVGNTGLALSRLGMRVKLKSMVGDDTIGQIVGNMLSKEQAACELTTLTDAPSTASIALAIPGRDKSTIHLRGASQLFRAKDFPPETFADVGLMHLGYPTAMRNLFAHEGRELEAILCTARECGVVTSMDTSLPDLKAEPGQINWQPILQRIYPLLDLFLPSLEEAVFMTDRARYVSLVAQTGSKEILPLLKEEDVYAIAEQAISGGTAIVLIKCGKRGLYLRTAGIKRLRELKVLSPDAIEDWANRELWCTPFIQPHVLSTTGAGDTAVAGFLCGLSSGMSPEDSLTLASYTAARCVGSWDTISRIEPAEQMILAAGAAPCGGKTPEGDWLPLKNHSGLWIKPNRM